MAELDSTTEFTMSSRKRKSSPQTSDRIATLLSSERLFISDHNTVTTKSSHNESWRERIAQWAYDVIDTLSAPRDVVFISMTVLDRYVSACLPLTEYEYKSAAIASLFIGLRLSGAFKTLNIQRLLQISPSDVTIKEALSRVTKILKTLSWDHPIPSPSAFVKAFLDLFQDTLVDKAQVSELMEHALYLVELSVCDPQFRGVPPSRIAFAAVLLSVNPATAPSCPKSLASSMSQVLFKKTGIDCSAIDVRSICSRLQSTYDESCDHDTCSSTPAAVAVIEEDEIVSHYSSHRDKRTKTNHSQACT